MCNKSSGQYYIWEIILDQQFSTGGDFFLFFSLLWSRQIYFTKTLAHFLSYVYIYIYTNSKCVGTAHARSCLPVSVSELRPPLHHGSQRQWMNDSADGCAGWPAVSGASSGQAAKISGLQMQCKCDPSLRRSRRRELSCSGTLWSRQARTRLRGSRHSSIHSFVYGFIDQSLARVDANSANAVGATCRKQWGRCHGFPHFSFILITTLERLWELCR